MKLSWLFVAEFPRAMISGGQARYEDRPHCGCKMLAQFGNGQYYHDMRFACWPSSPWHYPNLAEADPGEGMPAATRL